MSSRSTFSVGMTCAVCGTSVVSTSCKASAKPRIVFSSSPIVTSSSAVRDSFASSATVLIAIVGRFFCGCFSASAAVETPNCSTSSCSASTKSGALVIKSDASRTFGKAITSRRESAPSSCITRRSSPKANPPCGGVPYLKASIMKPKRARAVSSVKPKARNISACTSGRWIRIEPEPSSMPFSTTSYACERTRAGSVIR